MTRANGRVLSSSSERSGPQRVVATWDVPGVELAAAELLQALGCDVADENLRETPRRMAAAYAELLTPSPFRATTFPNQEGYDELVRSIPFHSLCMHHPLPFRGVAHVGYLPRERILGLSKPARVVEFYARDLQLQARLTVQVADRLQEHVHPKGVGDVANHDHPLLGRLRVEHWSNALNQGPAAAANMLGEGRPYARLPYFFSDQYDVGMEYSGHAADWDQVVFRGDIGAREFIAFWLRGGQVLAGMNVNVWDVTDDIQALIRGARTIDRRRLADPDVPLGQLAGGHAETTG